MGKRRESSLCGAELGHRLPGRASSRDDVALRRNNVLCVAVASAVSGSEQRRKYCSCGVCIYRCSVEHRNGERVELDLRITWYELKRTTVIAAVEIQEAGSPIVL